MSLESARARMDTLSNPHGYCFPLAVDSLLKRTELPGKYYEMFSEAIDDPTLGHNEIRNKLLRDFFKIAPAPETSITSVAQYNAFDASEQSYCPDVPYDYTEQLKGYLTERGVTNSQMRLRTLLLQTVKLDCLVILQTPGVKNDLHAQALEVVDKGGTFGQAQCVIRNNTYIEDPTIYSANSLSGMNLDGENTVGRYSPLPEITRPYYPAGGTSWSLVILPPEPR